MAKRMDPRAPGRRPLHERHYTRDRQSVDRRERHRSKRRHHRHRQHRRVVVGRPSSMRGRVLLRRLVKFFYTYSNTHTHTHKCFVFVLE